MNLRAGAAAGPSAGAWGVRLRLLARPAIAMPTPRVGRSGPRAYRAPPAHPARPWLAARARSGYSCRAGQASMRCAAGRVRRRNNAQMLRRSACPAARQPSRYRGRGASA